MASTPSPERVRLTISVTPEVHQTFTRLAAATSVSISRAMGDWLADTLEAAEHMTGLVERARQAPKQVARELHAYALGLADETGTVVRAMRAAGGGVVASATRLASAEPAPGAATAAPSPRPVIRGGKSPGKTRGR